MKTPPKNLERRLLFILHRALVEARLLSQTGAHTQIHDLADALEVLPGWIAAWEDEYLDALKENLATYQSKYPGGFDYLSFIEKHEPPAF